MDALEHWQWRSVAIVGDGSLNFMAMVFQPSIG
jgi:hypothetical protein